MYSNYFLVFWQILVVLDFVLKIYAFYILWHSKGYDSLKKILGFLIVLMVPFLGSLIVVKSRKMGSKYKKLPILFMFFVFSLVLHSCRKDTLNVSPDVTLSENELAAKNRIMEKFNLVESKLENDKKSNGISVESYEELEKLLEQFSSFEATSKLMSSSTPKKALALGGIVTRWTSNTFTISANITPLGTDMNIHIPFKDRKASVVLSHLSGFTALSSWTHLAGIAENTGDLAGRYVVAGQLHYDLPSYGTMYTQNKTIRGFFNGRNNTGTFSW